MKVIKDTMPTTYETKDGNIGFSFGFDFGLSVKVDNIIKVPIIPTLIFEVDNKAVGEFICLKEVEVSSLMTKDDIYQEVHKNLLVTLDKFNKLSKSKYAIPDSITLRPIPFLEVKPFIVDKLKLVL